MSKSLFAHYNQELAFIRHLAQDFARHYPGEAGRLLLESDRSRDPHVERMIESFALLAGRVQQRLDDDFPELTDALLGVLYPHYLAPIPSMAVVQFDLDPGRAELPNGFLIPRGSKLRTQPVGDLPCRYRTGYPVTLWPVFVQSAQLLLPPFPPGMRPPAGTVAALSLRLECKSELKFAGLGLEWLRFHLAGDNPTVASLYELIFNHVLAVAIRPAERDAKATPILLSPADCIRPVGFEIEDGLLPYPKQSFLGYRLLTEFFTFPARFCFFDLGGWRQAAKAGFANQAEVVFFLNRTRGGLENVVDAQTFRLGCAPVVNLFETTTEPINLTHTRYQYRIVPDVAHPTGMEVFSVESVYHADRASNRTVEYQPFYSFRHGGDRDRQRAFWYTSRRASLLEKDRGTDVFLHLVDLDFDPHLPTEPFVVARVCCTNRDLPEQLQRATDQVKFDLELAAPVARIRCVRTPTAPLRPPLRRGAYWRLVSHLSLNHLSISDPVFGRQALQELLRLYDFSDPGESGQQQTAAVVQRLIDGILAVDCRRVIGRTPDRDSVGICRGVEVAIEFDEQKYVGTGVLLFASVLERFLALYASINSFTQLVAKTRQGEGYFKKWPPRAGVQQLL